MDNYPSLTHSERSEEDRRYEQTLRPSTLDDFVGQKKIIENLKVFIKSARMRDETLDHILLAGPPGLGKTTLSYIIARELNVNIRATSAPVIDKAGDLASILSAVEEKDVLFIDEIHRLSPAIEEILYPAMEDRTLDIIIGQGVGAKSIKINLAPFTLIGATTRTGLLTSALRDRFGIPLRLDFYEDEELMQIALRTAGILGQSLERNAALEIARRSRRTPRIVNRLIRRVADFSTVQKNSVIDLETARFSLDRLDIDEKGLDLMDRTIIRSLIEKYGGGPVGIKTLAISVGEEPDTLEDYYEPFLLQSGFLKRTPRGRMATRLAYEHMGLPWNPPYDTDQKSLFNDES